MHAIVTNVATAARGANGCARREANMEDPVRIAKAQIEGLVQQAEMDLWCGMAGDRRVTEAVMQGLQQRLEGVVEELARRVWSGHRPDADERTKRAFEQFSIELAAVKADSKIRPLGAEDLERVTRRLYPRRVAEGS
jgi:hypothetical protein